MSAAGTGHVSSAGRLLAHGVGSRQDLPIPFSYALVGAAVALVVSFAALGLLWRTPRLHPDTDGRPLPSNLARVLDSPRLRATGLVLGVVMTGYVAMAALFGKDDALNPTAGVVFVLFWVGVPLASVLLGPVWSWLNPVRGIHAALSKAIGIAPEQGSASYPARLGYWPAAVGLLGFVWLELVAPDRTSLPVLRLFFAVYLGLGLLAVTYWGSEWFARGDGFDVFSALLGRLSFLSRRGDGRLVWRSPLAGVAGTPIAPGLFGVVGVLLGSTAFDSLSSSPWWVTRVQTSPLGRTSTMTLGLVVMVCLVTGAFAGAATLSGRGSGLTAPRVAGEYAHTLIPIVAGYFVAHYYTLLLFVGQYTVIQLSDPLGTGANWLGLSGRNVDSTLGGPGTVAVVQVTAVVGGHILGVVLAHDRAVRLLPRRSALVGQIPMLVLMVCYTMGGLTLLFAA